MAYIDIHNDIPGIRGLMQYSPDTAFVLNQLAQVLLADEASMPKFDRELIASFVSSRNECKFCMTSHGAIAAHLPGGDQELVEAVWRDYRSASISEKLKSLLNIADKVHKGGRHVTEADIAAAKNKVPVIWIYMILS